MSKSSKQPLSATEAAAEIILLTGQGKSREEIEKDHPDLKAGWALVEKAAGKKAAKKPRGRKTGSGSTRRQVTPRPTAAMRHS